MVHTHTTRAGNKRYRYYVCHRAQSRGWNNCPSPSVPAPEIERFVVDQIRAIGKDPDLLEEVLDNSRRERRDQIEQLQMEQRSLERELTRHGSALHKLAGALGGNDHAADRLADVQERIQTVERRLTEVRDQITGLDRELIEAGELAPVMAAFDPIWETLAPREQARILNLLIERVDYDGQGGQVSITFRQTGIRSLVDEMEVLV
jgi:site-specific DNA recombinase